MSRIATLDAIRLCGFTFKTIHVYKEDYRAGGTCIKLTHMTSALEEVPYEEPLATATAEIPGLSPDEVAIKDYSENDGMLNELIRHGVILPPHRHLRSGFMAFPICRLNPEFFNPPGTSGTTKKPTMGAPKQGSFKEAVEAFTQEEGVDITDYINDDDINELLETGSIEIDIEDSDTVIRLTTTYEIVTESPTDSQEEVFPTPGPDDGSDDGGDK